MRVAAAFGEMVFICLKGTVFLDVVKTLDATALGGKVVVDVSNPLDFSHGLPPSLSICNTNSLGEEVQKAVPSAEVQQMPRLKVVVGSSVYGKAVAGRCVSSKSNASRSFPASCQAPAG